MRWTAVLAGLVLCGVVAAGCSAGGSDPAGTGPAAARSSHPAVTHTSPTPAPSVVAKTAPNPCRHNRHGRLVKVNLQRQHLWMCQATTIAHQTPITSGIVGRYTHTPTGHYRIQALDRDQTLTLIDGQQYQVKYWIPFDAPLFGFHDASWQTFPFGSAKYRHHGSHGCVHMPTHAIAQLSHWAHLGTRVSIRR